MYGDKIEINEIGKQIYIKDIIDLIKKDKFEIVLRDKNENFIIKYNLDNKNIKQMLLSLEKDDIQYQVEDIEYTKYGPEPLVVFKKQFNLIDVFARNKNEIVYIKIKMKEEYLPIISFHLMNRKRRKMKNKKDYCLLCNEYVDSIIINKTKKYEDDLIKLEYDGKAAICPICGEELYNEEVIKYNRLKITEKYKIENEIITKEEINEIIEKYKIGKRPLSLLLGFGEITITRYLDGYAPTTKNSKILKNILYSPSDYYSILQMNKNNIKEVAFNKSEKATKKLLDIKTEDGIIEDAAKYIVNNAEITNLALQKILYYVQMFYMAIYKNHAFNSRCNAWEYGPVFGSIYYKYKKFGKNIIIDETPQNELNEDLKNTIDNVLKYFGCYTGLVLKSFTHKEEPWINAIKSEDKIIEKCSLKEYGEKIIKEYNINKINEINKYSEFMFKQYINS